MSSFRHIYSFINIYACKLTIKKNECVLPCLHEVLYSFSHSLTLGVFGGGVLALTGGATGSSDFSVTLLIKFIFHSLRYGIVIGEMYFWGTRYVDNILIKAAPPTVPVRSYMRCLFMRTDWYDGVMFISKQ